jgi:ABC-type sugar transport system ATPase subunit
MTAPVADPHVSLEDVSKSFGGTQAVTGATLAVARGSVHGLVGENGAGKSTLGKIITGVHRPDEGALLVNGRRVDYHSPRPALRDGLALIAQELSLAPNLTALENVFLGAERARFGLTSRRSLLRRYARLDEQTGFGIRPLARVRDLRVAEQQKVEILRAFARGVQLIVMDEPTAALAADEVERFFGIVETLKSRGVTIVYVSHFLDQVLRVSDTVTVMKDGRIVRTNQAASETPSTLIEGMLGRSLDAIFPSKEPPPADAPMVCSVRELRREGVIDDVSLQVRAGEIVGLAGLIGSGRSEVARAIFGADRIDGGTIEMLGQPCRIHTPRDAIRAGVGMIPESRKDQGLAMKRSIAENLSLAHLDSVSWAGMLRPRYETTASRSILEELDVRGGHPGLPVSALSGGNQQKVLFGRWLVQPPRLLIADEPTRGVDVGAKQAIYQLLVRLASEGMGILLISSELEEVMGLSHRVLVMRVGRVVAELAGDEITEDAVMAAAFESKGRT